MSNLDLAEIQHAVKSQGLDGWLFCDVWNRDPLAYQALRLDSERVTSRRWFYLVPAQGHPRKLVHRIEAQRLASLSGETTLYSTWQELHSGLKGMLSQCRKVAMQYSPNNDLFAIAYVDAGTIELVRSFGIDVRSSADLLQQFVSRLTPKGIALHKDALREVHRVKDETFALIFDGICRGEPITEMDAQDFILRRFDEYGLTSDGLRPVVAVNEHAANPHFEVSEESNAKIVGGDRILIDLWARVNHPEGVYADITWCGYAGARAPDDYRKLFEIVVEARNRAKALVVSRLAAGEELFGWQVDEVCRNHISDSGYGGGFTHRTGHSIDTRVHGSGVNIDNYETRDHRRILPRTCFSIEPGIYLGDVGVRSEIDLLIDEASNIHSGPEQSVLVTME